MIAKFLGGYMRESASPFIPKENEPIKIGRYPDSGVIGF
jgi:hypothetical protein